MTWNPLKSMGLMCHHWECDEMEPLHGITRRCLNGHLETLRYCAGHIDRMMYLAIHPPGRLPDGTHVGIPICHQCHSPMELVMEAA